MKRKKHILVGSWLAVFLLAIAGFVWLSSKVENTRRNRAHEELGISDLTSLQGKDPQNIAEQLARARYLFTAAEFPDVYECNPKRNKLSNKYMPNCDVYSASATDSLGNELFSYRPLILSPAERPVLLLEPQEVTDYLSCLNLNIRNTEEAKEIVELFAYLQNYKIDKGHFLKTAENEANESGSIRQWEFSAYYRTRWDRMRRHENCTIVLKENGKIIMTEYTLISKRSNSI